MRRVGTTTNAAGQVVTLHEAIYDYSNLLLSYNKARRGKRYRKEVLKYTQKKEENLQRTQAELTELTYNPSGYRYFKVYEPKERQIMALPFYDRVVQHAINNVLEPIFEKRFYRHSYACRKGKGSHAASDTLQKWLYDWEKYHKGEKLYAIKADIHAYFKSINHDKLKKEIRRVIKDENVLLLTDRIIDHNGEMPDGTGIPVGNLTSQLFANVYLDALDKYVKEVLGVKKYIRYMDDFIILSPDIEQLKDWLQKIEAFINTELLLSFNPKTTIVCASTGGIDFVGYKHRATHKKVRKDSIKRIKRTIKQYERGGMTIANWLSLGALAVALFMAVINTTNTKKSQKKEEREDTEKSTERTTGIMIALENIKNQLTRIENEINTVKQDNRENHDKLLIMEQSQKSEHKRLDAHEQRLNNIERQLRIDHYRDVDTEGE